MSSPETGRLHREFYRSGDNHRSGADVSFGDIVKLFGFKTVTIGKWVTPQEQQIAANLMFDALCDLMDILQVPERVISLSGSLSLAFGKGGNKHSSAHYSPSARTLALAKNAGAGALAHEWFHAFDHYICTKAFADCQASDFASQCWLNDKKLTPHPLNLKLDEFFRRLFLNTEGSEPNHYVTQSAKVDKALGMYYYAQPQELAARAFEAIIQQQPIKNHFLVSGTQQSQEAKLGIYPDMPLKQTLSSLLMQYFFQLGLRLNTSTQQFD